MDILNQRIKERRLAQGLTLAQVAEKLGVKEATVQRYESGDIKNIKHEFVRAPPRRLIISSPDKGRLGGI